MMLFGYKWDASCGTGQIGITRLHQIAVTFTTQGDEEVVSVQVGHTDSQTRALSSAV